MIFVFFGNGPTCIDLCIFDHIVFKWMSGWLNYHLVCWWFGFIKHNISGQIIATSHFSSPQMVVFRSGNPRLFRWLFPMLPAYFQPCEGDQIHRHSAGILSKINGARTWRSFLFIMENRTPKKSWLWESSLFVFRNYVSEGFAVRVRKNSLSFRPTRFILPDRPFIYYVSPDWWLPSKFSTSKGRVQNVGH